MGLLSRLLKGFGRRPTQPAGWTEYHRQPQTAVFERPFCVNFRGLTQKDLINVSKIEYGAFRSLGKDYHPRKLSELERMLAQGFCLGAYVDDQLVGIRLARAGVEIDRDMAASAFLSEKELYNTIELRGLVVLPELRDSALASALVAFAHDRYQRIGYRRFFSNVGVSNYQSLETYLSMGFFVSNFIVVHGKSKRLIMQYDGTEASPTAPPKEPVDDAVSVHLVPSTDIDGHQRELLAGRLGTLYVKSQNGLSIGYTLPRAAEQSNGEEDLVRALRGGR